MAGAFCSGTSFAAEGRSFRAKALPRILQPEVGGVAVMRGELGAVVEEGQKPLEEAVGGVKGKGCALGHCSYPKGLMSRIDRGRRIYPLTDANMAYQMPMRSADLT